MDGGARIMGMYTEYADAVTANEQPSTTKARLSALSAYAESQNLMGHVAFDVLRSLFSQLQVEMMDVRSFLIFYGFVFFMCREKGQKSISVTTAVNAWRLSLTGRFRLLDQWCAFVQIHQRHAISEDTWRQVLEFSRSVHEDLSNYDPEGAWPVLVDEFVDHMYRKNAFSRCCKDTHRICTCDTETTPSNFQRSSFSCGASTLPGMTAQVGSKRCWKDSSEDVESISDLSQRLERMPSPSSTKRMRPAEVSDPMEGVLERQDSWGQVDVSPFPGNSFLFSSWILKHGLVSVGPALSHRHKWRRRLIVSFMAAMAKSDAPMGTLLLLRPQSRKKSLCIPESPTRLAPPRMIVLLGCIHEWIATKRLVPVEIFFGSHDCIK